MNWRDYWNQDTPIYAGERHKLLHYRLIANDIIDLIISPETRVLDYGCGEALFADRVAAQCGALYLCDAAPLVRDRLREKFGANGKITVLSPEDLPAVPDGSLDLIVVNSLLQYLSLDELRSVLKLWHAKLKEDGRLIIADVIPPNVSPLVDAQALLSFAWKGGFLKAALAGLVRTALSDYRKIREEIGLSHYSQTDMLDVLRDAGFAAARRERNLGHNQARMTFIARPV
ncbi:class I SAM-dependent methyltransferase [Microvirga terricola]|uniref:Class I SAM-dependent methyltransferase n=1 Tax=Microvirga terricola TaxID=2719797 RepID=A0ABX0V9C8_9HYPH|nr:class I SAM-dependent methyltransferase [Microvirga terricola]NIX76318.1 class I SAM-dependent methyltransferase [Microvirga terricola]